MGSKSLPEVDRHTGHGANKSSDQAGQVWQGNQEHISENCSLTLFDERERECVWRRTLHAFSVCPNPSRQSNLVPIRIAIPIYVRTGRKRSIPSQ